jgi:hypothetical protein
MMSPFSIRRRLLSPNVRSDLLLNMKENFVNFKLVGRMISRFSRKLSDLILFDCIRMKPLIIFNDFKTCKSSSVKSGCLSLQFTNKTLLDLYILNHLEIINYLYLKAESSFDKLSTT